MFPSLSSPFILVTKVIRRLIDNAISDGLLKGIPINPKFFLSHLIFVDDILFFREGEIMFMDHLKVLLSTFFWVKGTKINMKKYSLYSWGLSNRENNYLSQHLNMHISHAISGMKYLGFTLKSNEY